MRGVRERVQRLRKFQLLKSFNYLQLTYLAQFIEDKTFVFKDYLYNEGSVPNEIYLIEEGEFLFTLFVEDKEENQVRTKLKEKINKNKKLSKQKNQPIDFQQPSFYSPIKPNKFKEFKVGSVIGGMGQSIGEQQIILNKQKRRYNAKCVSYQNQVIAIKKEHLLKVLNDNQQLLQNLKIQLTMKQRVTLQAHQKLYTVRNNMESMVRLLEKQSSRQKYNTQSTERFIQDKSLKLPLLERNNLTELKRKSTLMEKLHLRASNDSLLGKDRIEEKAKTHFLSESDLPSQTFMLTEFDSPQSQIRVKPERKPSKKNHMIVDKIKEQNEQRTLTLKNSKSENSKGMSPRQMLSKKKYNGVIDSTVMLKEKQRLVQLRKNHNQICDRAEFEEKNLKIWKQNLLEKERAKQSSTAHSKQFMEKMLLTALKKAGYQETIPQMKRNSQRSQNKTLGSENDNTQSQKVLENRQSFNNEQGLSTEIKKVRVQKLAMKVKKKRKAFFQPVTEILQNNPFDECYFTKLK